MKLIQSISLHYQSAKSDKIYQVNLFEVGEEQYIVNFKFGRRGQKLKEGTKTQLPVSRERAEQIVQKLVGEKSRKGYVNLGDRPIPEKAQTAPPAKDDREKAILKRLKDALAGKADETDSPWYTSRVVWRVGELKMKAAEDMLMKLCAQANHQDHQLIYCLIWAFGRIESNQAEQFAMNCLENMHFPAHIHRLASAYLLKFASLPIQQKIQENLTQSLSLLSQQQQLEQNAMPKAWTLRYLLKEQQPELATNLLQELQQHDLKPPYFRAFRHILKLAEWQLDAPYWAAIMHKIEREPAFFSSPAYGYIYVGWESFPFAEEMEKENARFAFSNKTKAYLQRRSMRFLSRVAELSAKSYVEMASQLLLTFDDEQHGKGPFAVERVDYEWNPSTRRYTTIRFKTHYDWNAHYLSFNYILFQNSARYELNGKKNAWQCTGDYEPGNPAPTAREEAFPAHWDEHPETLMQLLQQSNAHQVHEFACKALLANPNLEKVLSVEQVALLFNSRFEVSQNVALDLAKRLYNPQQPAVELLVAMLASNFEAAVQQANAWLEEAPASLFDDTHFIAKLFFVNQEQHHIWLRSFLEQKSIASHVAQASLDQVLYLLGTDQETGNSYLFESLKIAFPTYINQLPTDTISQFLNHPQQAIQLFGLQLLNCQQSATNLLTEDLLNALVQSEHQELKVAGIQLFNKLDKAKLIQWQAVLLSLCDDEEATIRENAAEVLASLLTSKSPEGEKLAFKLLESAYTAAQQIGADYLFKFFDLANAALSQVIFFGKHELLSLRELCWDYFEKNVARIKYEREQAINLLDTDWQDTQAFGFQFFKEKFEEKDWTADLLIALCDSVRWEVQEFGKEMITHYFDEKEGGTYLLHLSQHPDPNMQLFVTNFLDRFANENAVLLQKLRFYLTSVLTRVNLNRAAKVRVLAFLKKQMLLSPELATSVIDVLRPLLGTVSKGDKSEYLVMLMAISKQYPHLPISWETNPITTWQRK